MGVSSEDGDVSSGQESTGEPRLGRGSQERGREIRGIRGVRVKRRDRGGMGRQSVGREDIDHGLRVRRWGRTRGEMIRESVIREKLIRENMIRENSVHRTRIRGV